MENFQKFRAELKALEFYIYACGLGFTIYTGLLCLGYRSPLVEFLALTLGFLLLIGGAVMYKLCWLSHATIVYLFAIRSCMIFHELDAFGKWYDLATLIAFVWGLVLSIFAIRKFCCRRRAKVSTHLEIHNSNREVTKTSDNLEINKPRFRKQTLEILNKILSDDCSLSAEELEEICNSLLLLDCGMDKEELQRAVAQFLSLPEEKKYEVIGIFLQIRLNREQICQYFGVSNSTILRWQAKQKLHEFRKDSGGKQYLYLSDCLNIKS